MEMYEKGITLVGLISICMDDTPVFASDKVNVISWDAWGDGRIVLTKRRTEPEGYILKVPPLPTPEEREHGGDIKRWFALRGIATEMELEWDADPFTE